MKKIIVLGKLAIGAAVAGKLVSRGVKIINENQQETQNQFEPESLLIHARKIAGKKPKHLLPNKSKYHK